MPKSKKNSSRLLFILHLGSKSLFYLSRVELRCKDKTFYLIKWKNFFELSQFLNIYVTKIQSQRLLSVLFHYD
jgi:hypothetical protein